MQVGSRLGGELAVERAPRVDQPVRPRRAVLVLPAVVLAADDEGRIIINLKPKTWIGTAVQSTQLVLPLSSWYLPASHLSHVLCPAAFWKVPGLQGV